MSNYMLKYDRAVIQGPDVLTQAGSSANNAWWGRTNVVSDTGGMSAVVSTQVVASMSVILVTPQNMSVVTSDVSFTFCVATISPGNFFKIQGVSSAAMAAGSYTAMWVMFNPTPTNG